MVNPEDLRRLEAAERNAASAGAPSIHNRSISRRRGDANINLPDEDMITGEDGVSGCAAFLGSCATQCSSVLSIGLLMPADYRAAQRWHFAVRRRPPQHVRAV